MNEMWLLLIPIGLIVFMAGSLIYLAYKHRNDPE